MLPCWSRFPKKLGSFKPHFDLCQLCRIYPSRTVIWRIAFGWHILPLLNIWEPFDHLIIISYKDFESFWFSFDITQKDLDINSKTSFDTLMSTSFFNISDIFVDNWIDTYLKITALVFLITKLQWIRLFSFTTLK